MRACQTPLAARMGRALIGPLFQTPCKSGSPQDVREAATDLWAHRGFRDPDARPAPSSLRLTDVSERRQHRRTESSTNSSYAALPAAKCFNLFRIADSTRTDERTCPSRWRGRTGLRGESIEASRRSEDAHTWRGFGCVDDYGVTVTVLPASWSSRCRSHWPRACRCRLRKARDGRRFALAAGDRDRRRRFENDLRRSAYCIQLTLSPRGRCGADELTWATANGLPPVLVSAGLGAGAWRGFGSPSSDAATVSVTGAPTLADRVEATVSVGGLLGSSPPGSKLPLVITTRSLISCAGISSP